MWGAVLLASVSGPCRTRYHGCIIQEDKSAEYDLFEYPTPTYALVLGVGFNMPTLKVLGRETGSW